MKLPILIEVDITRFNESPLVYLGAGDWDIIHNLNDSDLSLSSDNQELPYLVSKVTECKLVGPCRIKISAAKVGSEKSISIYAQKCH